MAHTIKSMFNAFFCIEIPFDDLFSIGASIKIQFLYSPLIFGD